MSLKYVMGLLGPAFTAQHPSYTLRYNWGSSGKLRAQIQYGAPVDLFLSAGQKEMDLLEQTGSIVASTRITFAKNQIVLITPQGHPLITSLATLQHSKGRVAIGNPQSVPAGRYAKRILIQNSLYNNLKKRLVFGETVRQVFDWVHRGEVVAGFVFRSDLHQGGERVRVVTPLKTPHPIRYPAARTAQSHNPKGAQAFLTFLRSQKAQHILAAAGFRGE